MFNVMKCAVLRLLRSPADLFLVLIFPSLLIFVLGNMLANMDNADYAIPEIRLGYTAEQKDSMYLQAQQIFLDALEENDGIKLVEMSSDADAEEAANNGDIDAAIILSLPDDITVYEGDDAIINRAVKLMAQSFVREYTAAETVITRPNAAAYFANAEMMASEKAKSVHSGSSIESKTADESRNMIDYYAVAMIVMIAFISGAITGAVTLYQNRIDGTLRRVLCAPKKRSTVFIDYVLAPLPQNLMQTLMAMAIASIFFGAHYAQTAAQNLLLFAALTLVGFTVTTFFMIIGLLVRTNPNLPLMAIMWVVLFLSGSFNKDIGIEGVSQYLPPSIIQDAAFDLTVFGRDDKLLMVMGVCIVVSIVAAIIGAFMLNQKRITE